MFVHTCCCILFFIVWFETKLQNDSNGFENGFAKTFEIKKKKEFLFPSLWHLARSAFVPRAAQLRSPIPRGPVLLLPCSRPWASPAASRRADAALFPLSSLSAESPRAPCH